MCRHRRHRRVLIRHARTHARCQMSSASGSEAFRGLAAVRTQQLKMSYSYCVRLRTRVCLRESPPDFAAASSVLHRYRVQRGRPQEETRTDVVIFLCALLFRVPPPPHSANCRSTVAPSHRYPATHCCAVAEAARLRRLWPSSGAGEPSADEAAALRT